jgi:hypothetical protein
MKTGGAGTTGAAGAGLASGTAGDAGTMTGASGDTGTTTGASGSGSMAGATGSGGAAGTGAAAGTGGGPAGGGGSGGSGGSGSTAGATGAGGGGAGGAAVTGPTGMSAGCGMPPTQALATMVQHNIMVTGLDPTYAATYSMRKYTTVFLGPGCGGTGKDVIPVWDASMGDAIIVGLSPVGQCFKTNGDTSPENPFFDAVLSEVEANACVDKARVFVAGFSSGSWLANQLGCLRASVLRGQGNATGGLPGSMPMCEGPIAAMLAHDTTDTANPISGGEAARDRILMINGCVGTATTPYDAGTPSPCVQYTGCPAAYPVVWCATTGKGHSDQIPISTIGFWKFWSSLP